MKTFVISICLGLAAFGQSIPSSVALQIRLIDTIDSSKAVVGQNFAASVAEDIASNGRTVVARGALATVQLLDLQKSGKFKGKAGLGVVLTHINVNGRNVAVESGEVTRTSGSQGKNTAVKTGIGAGIGAAIGAIAGGGKGAAIGAGAGAAAGAGSQIFTNGKKVQIPSETILTFVLLKPAPIGKR